MRKIGKGFLTTLLGSDKNSCCCGSSIVSIRKIKIDNQDVELAGLDEEFEKFYVAGQGPKNIDNEELIQKIAKINVIPEEKLEAYKSAIFREYTKYWEEKSA